MVLGPYLLRTRVQWRLIASPCVWEVVDVMSPLELGREVEFDRWLSHPIKEHVFNGVAGYVDVVGYCSLQEERACEMLRIGEGSSLCV